MGHDETERRLQEIEAREAMATKGPWLHGIDDEFRADPLMGSGGWIFEPNGDSVCTGDGGNGFHFAADADFTAHAREDIPWLLARVRELEGDAAHRRTAATEGAIP